MEIPDIINKIADKKRDETEELVVNNVEEPDEESVEKPVEKPVKKSIEELQRGMKFYADMLNRLFFCIIIAVICIAFGCTFVRAWIQYFFP